MALAIDQRANQDFGGTATPSIASYTVNAVSPLFVLVVNDQDKAVTSVNWNTSEALTLIVTKTSGSGTNFRSSLYALINPTTGTHAISVVFSVAPSSGCIFAIGTTGGDTTTGYRSGFSRNDVDGTGPGLTVTDAVNGDIVLHGTLVFSTTVVFDGGEDTTNTEFDNIQANTMSGGLSTKAATGSTVVGCTDVGFYSEVAVAAIASIAASPALTVTLGEPQIGGSVF